MAVTSDIDDLPAVPSVPGIASKGRAFRRWSTRELCQVAMTPTAGLSSAQFVDMTIPTSIYHLPAAPCFPGIADKSRTFRQRSARDLRQVAMSPRTHYSHHDFMNMAVAPRVHDLFGAIRFPGIASNSNTTCVSGTSKLIHQVSIAPSFAVCY